MVETGDEFFQALKENNISQAYTHLAEDFRSNTKESEFKEFVEKNSISNFKESSWEERSISGGRGVLTGSISTESGGVIPIKLSFVKGDNGWKIYSIEKPSSGFLEETETHSMPSESEQIELIKRSAREFAVAVNKKSCADFYSMFSSTFRQQFSIEKLDEAYKSFYDLGVDLLVLQQYSPVFDKKPSIDENGVLQITGYFPTEPNKFYFDQKYIYEGLGWKLLGYSVNIK
ncbi:MAG: hypothetical protein ABW155_13230 [Candidatus Thiodiazotropha sp.]